MEHLSNRVKQLNIPLTIGMAHKTRELVAQGKDVISLTLGEPDFDTPDFIKEAAKEGIDQNYTHYMPIRGFLDLRQAISLKFKNVNRLDYNANQIVVSNGAKQSIANAILCLVNPGDEVIVPAPYFASYIEQVKLADGIVVEVKTTAEMGFKFTAQQLQAAINPKTKLLIFSTPNNPSGAVYTKQELAAFAEVLADHPHVFVICDEIYEYLNYTEHHTSLASFSKIYNQVITVNGLSKGYAMTGWRLGYMGAPQWIADACDKIQAQFTSGACSISQRAAIAAVSSAPSAVKYMVDQFQERRILFLSAIQKINGFKAYLPDGAFYIFADVSELLQKSEIKTDVDLCYYFLENALVAAVPGTAFGLPGYIRFSYATKKELLEKAAQRLENAANTLLGQ